MAHFFLLVNGIHGGRICFSSLIALKKKTEKMGRPRFDLRVKIHLKSWVGLRESRILFKSSNRFAVKIIAIYITARYVSFGTYTRLAYMIRLLSDYRIIMIQLIVYLCFICTLWNCNLADVLNIHMHVIAPNLNANILLLTRKSIKFECAKQYQLIK